MRGETIISKFPNMFVADEHFGKKWSRVKGMGGVECGHWFATSNRQDKEALTKKMILKEIKN